MDAYLSSDRGNRINPQRSDKNAILLGMLLAKLREIVHSSQLTSGEAMLDFGCGDRPYESLFTKKFRKSIGADLPGNDLADVRINPDGTLPLEAATFDCVLSSQVLEHVANPELYLEESFRVLKPGGSLVLSTHGTWPYHPDPNDYWRWTIEGLQLLIRRAGFEIVTMKGVFGLESVAIQLWQESTADRCPKALQQIYTWLLQSCIGFIERRHPDKLSNDASVYLVLARKPGNP